MHDFTGVKIALIHGHRLIVYLRDDRPQLQYAGLWDLPGGGRENGETPDECAIREIQEEFGFELKPAHIVWRKTYPAAYDPAQTVYFMVATITEADIRSINFGSEGQRWKLMTLDEFISEPKAVGPLQQRLKHYLASARPLT